VLCTDFFVFARFLCFWFFFLCLGLESCVFAGELRFGADIGVHDNHHKMEKKHIDSHSKFVIGIQYMM
jgi:hypothetical protein